MKTLYYFLFGFLALSMFACQPFDDPETPSLIDDVPNLDGIPKWELSYSPTKLEYMNIEEQSVEIDFSLDEIMADAISFRGSYFRDNGQVFEGDLFDTYTSFDKLAGYYGRNKLAYNFSYSSNSLIDGGEIVYPPVEYALAQECFRDDCPTEARKIILKMALDKHKRKTGIPYLLSFNSRRTGMFLMAVILAKERDTAFLATVRENPNIQNTLRLNLDTESLLNILINTKTDSTVCQLVENFLSGNE